VIYGERIKQVRELLGETQADFGSEVGLPQATLSRLERTVGRVPLGTVDAIASHAGFPAEFFHRPPGPTVDEYQFRARLRIRASDRHRAVRSAEIVHESFEIMRRESTPLSVTLPDLTGVPPTEAAARARHLLDTHPLAPMPNLLLPIERTGVVVLALPITAQKHDAFCWWHNRTSEPYPVIAVLAGSPGDRLRWSVAHELGHLLLHRTGGGSPDIEREADIFAAELLTPLAALEHEMPKDPKLSNLYAMKARWGVSVQSLIRRARDLERITDVQYSSLFRQISARGERMNERYHVKREKPRAYRKTAEVLFGAVPAQGLAAAAAWTPDYADEVLAQFAGHHELPARRTATPTRVRGGGDVIDMRTRRSARPTPRC
jgi:Zn-dependent peptidase ImmA (M78 family)/transcriptional regulator with XRE-family HTH domain